MRHARICLSAALLAMLAACGADGVPLRPAAKSDSPVAVAMEARLGLSGQSR